MPLSGAERTRRYREKLKKDPEKLELLRKKRLDRLKSTKKKISQLISEEAAIRRENWKKYKRLSRINKKTKITVDPNVNCSTYQDTSRKPDQNGESDKHKKILKRLRKKCKFLFNKCRRLESYTKRINTQKETNRKRYQRNKNAMQKTINSLNTRIEKLQARQEVLENTLKRTYQDNCSKNEKKILRKLVINSENKGLVSKALGLKCKARIKSKKIRRSDIKEIMQFYIKDDVSRNTAGKRETRTKNKEKVQIRYLFNTLVNTFKKYKSEEGRYGFTTFYKHKPFYVLSPSLGSRSTCLCIKHSNFGFLHTAMTKYGLITGSTGEIMSKVSCDTNNYICMSNKCRQCKDINVPYEVTSDDKLDQRVEWLQWERVDHIYQKNDGETTKDIRTKKTAKVTKTGTLRDLKNDYEKSLVLYRKHHFNMIHQQAQYQKAVTGLKENEAVIVCDFSENYDAKLANEVQSMHYGASNRQISLHTGMVYWKDASQSFCTISDNTSHQPAAIWAHLKPIIDMIKQANPDTKVIHFFSDGPSSQYRQKKNFYLLSHFTAENDFKYTTWSFYESGHGKNVADGIGGSVKRTLDKKVSCGNDVVDAEDAYRLLKESLRITKVFLIANCEIDRISNILPPKLPVLKGTMQLHQVITSEDVPFKIKYRDISCFCGVLKGQCDCYSPQPHSVTTSDIIGQAGISINLSRTPTNIAGQDLIEASETFEVNNEPEYVSNPDLPLDLVDICLKPLSVDTPNLIDHTVFPLEEIDDLLWNNHNGDQSQRNEMQVIYAEENHECLSVDLDPIRENTTEIAGPTSKVDLKSDETPISTIESIDDEISDHLLENDKTSPAATTSNRKRPMSVRYPIKPVETESNKRRKTKCNTQKKILPQAVGKVTTCSANKALLKPNRPSSTNTEHIKVKSVLEKRDSQNRTSKRILRPRSETQSSKENHNPEPVERKQIPDKRSITGDPSTLHKAVDKVSTRSSKTNLEVTKCKKVDTSNKRSKRALTTFIDFNKCLTSILGQKSKCMVCKKWYCTDCIDGDYGIDYICDSCLED